MPSSYTPSQKASIAQFVGFTQVKDSVAAKQLKSHGWNVEQAVDAFYQSSNAISGSGSSSSTNLNKIFDKYRESTDEADRIGVNGSMKYLQDLGLKLDEPVLLTVMAELAAPTMGEFARPGFIEGWARMRADTLAKQQTHIPSLRRSLPANADLFKKTYKATFLLGRSPGAKVLQLETAIEYWRLLLSAPSLSWSSQTTPWLEWWLEYLESKWKKSVSKDMWDQTLLFVTKSLEDETMGWWNEEGSWPGVIDEFVAYVRGKKEEGKMDVG